MSASTHLSEGLRKPECEFLETLTTPVKIQDFLDGLPYSTEYVYRCPLRVLWDRVAHCFDGALFAAAALRRLDYPPLILEMVPNDRDDDHLLALYKDDGYWGAVAKSNFAGLRFREPIYRTLRELVLSYFEQYYNVEGEKTLRAYTLPVDLQRFDRLQWMVSDEHLEYIVTRIDGTRRFPLITAQMSAGLSP